MILPTPPPAGYAPVVAAEARTDAGPGQTCAYGILGQTFQSSNQSGAAAPCTDAPPAGLTLVILDCEISVAVAMTVTLTDSAGKAFGVYYFAQAGTIQITTRGKKRLQTINSALYVQTSVTGNIAVTPTYYAEY